jgi:hypothetical protein
MLASGVLMVMSAVRVAVVKDHADAFNIYFGGLVSYIVS